MYTLVLKGNFALAQLTARIATLEARVGQHVGNSSLKYNWRLNMDLSEQDPAMRERIIQIAESWCKQQFKQPWVEIYEVCETAIAYPNGVWGYRVIVKMPSYPEGEHIDILVAPDGSMTGKHIP